MRLKWEIRRLSSAPRATQETCRTIKTHPPTHRLKYPQDLSRVRTESGPESIQYCTHNSTASAAAYDSVTFTIAKLARGSHRKCRPSQECAKAQPSPLHSPHSPKKGTIKKLVCDARVWVSDVRMCVAHPTTVTKREGTINRLVLIVRVWLTPPVSGLPLGFWETPPSPRHPRKAKRPPRLPPPKLKKIHIPRAVLCRYVVRQDIIYVHATRTPEAQARKVGRFGVILTLIFPTTLATSSTNG